MSDLRVQGLKPVGAGQNAIASPALIQPLSRGEASGTPRGEGAGKEKKLGLAAPDSSVSGVGASGGEDVGAVTEQINAVMRTLNTRVTFEINRETGDVIIRLIDTMTGQVLREIPPHELRAIAITLAELAGALVDKKG